MNDDDIQVLTPQPSALPFKSSDPHNIRFPPNFRQLTGGPEGEWMLSLT